MSHIVIENIIIKENQVKITLHNKINEIKNDDLIETFCWIHAFKILEDKKGNEYDKAWLKIKYIEDMPIYEYINIFKLIRIPSLYDFVKYFKSIEEKFNQQSNETKINLDEYFNQKENISQDILIIMVFDIISTKEEINKLKEKLWNLLKITKADKDIFLIIK